MMTQTRPTVKPRVLFDATRPRAANWTFGLGVNLDLQLEYCEMLAAAEPIAPAPRHTWHPSPADVAWNVGYGLGRRFAKAAPDRAASEAEKAAWLDGYQRGHWIAEDEALAADADWNRCLDAVYGERELA